MPYTKQDFLSMQRNEKPVCAEHLIKMEEGILEAYTGIIRVESAINDKPQVNLRDLESGTYVLYGYFSPYENSNSSIVCDDLVHVAHKNGGSHLMCMSALNAKITFIEILVDDTVPDGFTFTRQSFDMLAINGLLERVAALEAANATE